MVLCYHNRITTSLLSRMILFKYFLKEKVRVPRVIIKYGRLIDPIFTFYCQNNPDLKKRGWNDWTPPSKEELDRRIKAYKEEWGKYNIVKDISDCLGLSFRRDIIDVFIVSGISRASSHPIIIKSGFKPKEFVITLAHELTHVILSNNKIRRIIFDNKESDITNNHVPTFAVLKKILDNELWKIEVRRMGEHGTNEYTKALTIMEKIGSDKVIEMIRAGKRK